MAMVFKTYGHHTPESLAAMAGPASTVVRVLYKSPRTPKATSDYLDTTKPRKKGAQVAEIVGAQSRNRTRDTGIFNPLLYQLS